MNSVVLETVYYDVIITQIATIFTFLSANVTLHCISKIDVSKNCVSAIGTSGAIGLVLPVPDQ